MIEEKLVMICKCWYNCERTYLVINAMFDATRELEIGKKILFIVYVYYYHFSPSRNKLLENLSVKIIINQPFFQGNITSMLKHIMKVTYPS